MLFCEKCNLLSEKNKCDNCGNENLREANGDDFCFFGLLCKGDLYILKSNLQEKNIEVAVIPYGGFDIIMPDRTSAYFKVYIKYKDLSQANEIKDILFGK